MDDLNGKTWEDDLGQWEHIRFELTSDEDGMAELPDDEFRRLWYGTLNPTEESKQTRLGEKEASREPGEGDGGTGHR